MLQMPLHITQLKSEIPYGQHQTVHVAFGLSVGNGNDAKHGVDPATLGPKLPHHIQSAVHTNTESLVISDR